MSDFINTLDLLEDEAVINSIIDKTITEFQDDVVTYLKRNVFSHCTALKKIVLPNVTYMNGLTFDGCTALEILDLPSLVAFAGQEGGLNYNHYHLDNCSSLKALILRYTTAIVKLTYTTVLHGSSIESGTGYIYVPSALIDSYKTASVWSNYADQFRALEDYTVDGTIYGELDESKI